MVKIQVHTILSLRELVGGNKKQIIEIEEVATVASALKKLSELYGEPFQNKIFDDDRNINPGIAMFVNGRVIGVLQGLDTVLEEGDELLLFPPVSGG